MKQPKGVLELLASQLMVTQDACMLCYFIITDNNGSPILELSIIKDLPCAKVPESLSSWMCIKHIPQLCCIQDIVHIGVKLKARMLKPSIVLPLGTFLVTETHFSMLINFYSKDQHGLRSRDLDHQDRQNFDAITHILNASQSTDDFLDAVGTQCYVDVTKSVTDRALSRIRETERSRK